MGNRFSLLVWAQILCQALGAAGMRQDGGMEGEAEQERGVGQADTDGALAWGDKQKD